jgi:RNA-directed DNA polymerase
VDGETNVSTQVKPTTVSATTKQVGDVRARWAWAEASVWSDRMLTALENGVKGDVWFSLMDKMERVSNLRTAFAKVQANRGAAGVDHQTCAMYATHLDTNLEQLSCQLRSNTYRPQAIRRVYIPKPGSTEKRPLGIPTVRDRVVQTAIRQVIEPIFEREFAEHSYGFRPGRGCKDALRRVDELLRSGYGYIVDVDLKSYFDTIPHAKLLARVSERIADGRVLRLIESYLTQGVMEEMQTWTPTAGSPQGAVISPLLSNIYLNPLDHQMANSGYEMVRYADDLVILCRTREEADAALQQVQAWTTEAGLTLHPTKTRIANLNEGEGFDFLGYHFQRDRRNPQRILRWPREKSRDKLKNTLREKTPRCSGVSLSVTIAQLNRMLRGWFEYFKHTNVSTVFPRLDGWLRRRLRRMLLKRHRCTRRNGMGTTHRRWPNAYFARLGLYSLATAHALVRQSAKAVNY